MLNGVVRPPKGRYVLAVSGGVDSAVLLDVLAKDEELELVVGHYNHRMRSGSGKDEKLARGLANQYGFKFETSGSFPGQLKSEDDARKARYSFLEKIRSKHNASAIITAHHQDDLIETALINLLRGTGPKGLSAISTNPKILRPLLNVPKAEILEYAKKRGLHWLEDPTNLKSDYLRNYLRNQVLVNLSSQDRDELIDNLQKVANTNSEVDRLIATISRDIIRNNILDRVKFTNLPLKLGNELLAYWFKSNNYRSFDKKMINQVSTSIKTAKPSTLLPINTRLELFLTNTTAILRATDGDA